MTFRIQPAPRSEMYMVASPSARMASTGVCSFESVAVPAVGWPLEANCPTTALIHLSGGGGGCGGGLGGGGEGGRGGGGLRWQAARIWVGDLQFTATVDTFESSSKSRLHCEV